MSDPPGIAKDTGGSKDEADTFGCYGCRGDGGMGTFAGPAMADVDFDDLYEERLEERADIVEEYYDEVEDAYEDGFFFYSPFVIYDIDGEWNLD